MAKKSERADLDTVRSGAARVNARVLQLAALCEVAYEDLHQPSGVKRTHELQTEILKLMVQLSDFLESGAEILELLDGRGDNWAALKTLEERRDALDRVIEIKRAGHKPAQG